MPSQIDSPLSSKPQSPKPIVMNLKEQLRHILELKGMTAAELSRKSGVSKQVISLWLTGGKPKNIEQVKKVALVLNTSVDHLVFGDGPDSVGQKTLELDALLGDQWVSGLFEVRFRRVKK